MSGSGAVRASSDVEVVRDCRCSRRAVPAPCTVAPPRSPTCARRHGRVAGFAHDHTDATAMAVAIAHRLSRPALGEIEPIAPDPGGDGRGRSRARIAAGTPVDVLMETRRARGGVGGCARSSCAGGYGPARGRRRVRQGQQRRATGSSPPACSPELGAMRVRDVCELARRDQPRRLRSASPFDHGRSADRRRRRRRTMYGTGLRGALDGDAAALAGELGSAPARVLAVDIPSGVDGFSHRRGRGRCACGRPTSRSRSRR